MLAFKIIQKLRNKSFIGISIAVLSDETPKQVTKEADYSVENIGELMKFFKWLLKNS